MNFTVQREQRLGTFRGVEQREYRRTACFRIAVDRPCRSTLVQSSLNTPASARSLRALTWRCSTPTHRDTILSSLAPEWLPIDVAMAHYAACDALQMSALELHEIGEEVGNRIQGTFLGTIVRRARAVGLTPWITLAQIERLWDRLFEGELPD